MNRRRWTMVRIGAALVAVVAARGGRAAAQGVEFSDGVFTPADWMQFRYLGGHDAIGGVYDTQQMAAGGAPAEFRQVMHIWTGPGDLIVLHLRNGAVYDPALSGAIDDMDAWVDAAFSPVVPPFSVGCGVALVQNGRLFVNKKAAISPNWTRLGGLGLTALDFQDFYNPDLHPDFSAAGPAIQFGFLTSNGIECACGRTTTLGVDNWTVRIHSGAAACPVDLNADGLVDFSDYLEFLNRYDAQDPSVDFNQDGLVDFGDYLEFLNLYEAGC